MASILAFDGVLFAALFKKLSSLLKLLLGRTGEFESVDLRRLSTSVA